ncbi:HAD-IA family hydrolase [Saccharopolyspora indica]|uniref:HAD family hydrolase n=1 Tax=Saccharopolyspora indica TaxID=1229659 RepID=UPI0022EAD77E|nr:HAD-IA family hydrolase [Saccharopolyspora indica]MDA3644153.1 HAD-IA family hydrolase [Saccharopolyspora indica]
MTARGDLTAVLGRVSAVLFDFDGPLCDVFAGLPAGRIAVQLGDLVEAETGERIDLDTDDPMEVLRRSVGLRPNLTREVDQALLNAELSAVQVSVPNLAGVAALRTSLESGMRVGIVSNNAKEAVDVFLRIQGLGEVVSPVIGRALGHPDRMKPNPEPLVRALDDLELSPGEAVLVGDSLTDIEACRAVGMPCIAYANKPGKAERFVRADAVVDNMTSLADALAEVGKR